MSQQDFLDFWTLVQEVWTEGLYGLDIGHALLAIVIFAFFLMLRGAITSLILNRVAALAARTSTQLDDMIVGAIRAPVSFLPIVLGLFLATSALPLGADLQDFVNAVNRSMVAFLLFWLLHSAADPLGGILNHAEKYLTGAMIEWLAKFLKIAIILLGGATILEIWGIQVGPLIAGLGLFGVAVALGAQDLFKNLIAGLFVLGERRFLPGDWIAIDGVVEGTVEAIGFRTTTVRQFDKAPVYVPNSELTEHAVVNYSRMTYRRIKWSIGIRYDASADQLREIRAAIDTYLRENEAFVQPEDTSTFVRIDHFGGSSINILLYCFTKTTNWLRWLEIKEELLLKIKDIVEAAGTDFAFPSQSLYVEQLPPGFTTIDKTGSH